MMIKSRGHLFIDQWEEKEYDIIGAIIEVVN